MSERFPGYDVLAKRHTPSWNEKTRRVIDQRLALPQGPRFLTAAEWQSLEAVCNRILPQPKTRPPVPVAAMIDAKLFENGGDGYRDHRLPPLREAWRRGLSALDAEARHRHSAGFHALEANAQDEILRAAQDGRLALPAWQGMDCAVFFAKRLLRDIVTTYYAHPTSWNEIGFGGPASPRGYVRMGFDRRDPWEAVAAEPDKAVPHAKDKTRAG